MHPILVPIFWNHPTIRNNAEPADLCAFFLFFPDLMFLTLLLFKTESFTELNMMEMIVSCHGCERIQGVLVELARERALPDLEPIDIPSSEGPPTAKEIDATETENSKRVEAAFSDTSMGSPPEQNPSSIHFEVGDDDEEVCDTKKEFRSQDNSSNNAPAKGPTLITASEVAISDDVPALVETAPSPQYSDAEETNAQAGEWGWGVETAEG
ncbi:unnamed protein product, partial [Strongylus vulgaris]